MFAKGIGLKWAASESALFEQLRWPVLPLEIDLHAYVDNEDIW